MPETECTNNDDWAPLDAEDLVAEHARLRKECPVAFSSLYGGYWNLSRYTDVAAAARDYRRFRSGVPFIPVPDFPRTIPLSINPPEHTLYRRALNKYFAPERMDAFAPTVERIVTEELAPLLARGTGEFVSEFAEPVPARVLAAFLGMPDEASLRLIAAQNEALAASVAGDGAAVGRAVSREISALITERRAHPRDPETDLVSGVLTLRVDGRTIGEQEVQGICDLTFLAGHSTTRDSIAAAIRFVGTDRSLQGALRATPERIPSAVEEFLRLDPPLHALGRIVSEEVTLHDRTIPQGSSVALNFAAANRDGGQFPQPDQCVIDRNPNRHLTFGHGVHKCLGMPLARLQLRVVLEALLGKTRHLELIGTAERREARPVAFGYERLSIALA